MLYQQKSGSKKLKNKQWARRDGSLASSGVHSDLRQQSSQAQMPKAQRVGTAALSVRRHVETESDEKEDH